MFASFEAGSQYAALAAPEFAMQIHPTLPSEAHTTTPSSCIVLKGKLTLQWEKYLAKVAAERQNVTVVHLGRIRILGNKTA